MSIFGSKPTTRKKTLIHAKKLAIYERLQRLILCDEIKSLIFYFPFLLIKYVQTIVDFDVYNM